MADRAREPRDAEGSADVRMLRLEGSPGEIGQALGEECREDIAALYSIRLDNALAQAKSYGGRLRTESELLALAGACLDISHSWDPVGTAELEGIALGSNTSPEEILALGGLTDLRDVLAWGGDEWLGGCTAFVVSREASASGELLCGQSWDLGTANLPFLIAVNRRPIEGPETWCITTAGCLSLMGVNDRGLAIGTTNLRCTDGRAGVPYLGILHRALASTGHDEATRVITRAPRAGAHSYLVADAEGLGSVVECTATRSQIRKVGRGLLVQTNHCQFPENRELEADHPIRSSETRLYRMTERLSETRPRISPITMRSALADHENDELAICRHDFDGISTNAAILIAPESIRAWACHGNPCEASWFDLMREPDN